MEKAIEYIMKRLGFIKHEQVMRDRINQIIYDLAKEREAKASY